MRIAVAGGPSTESETPPATGRYVLSAPIGAGGMATVHLGRLLGAAGFRRTVAVKRLHPHLAEDPYFLSMFVDEARLAARIRHPNVVGTIDVEAADGKLLLVMEYVHGESLALLLRSAIDKGLSPPLPVVSAVMCGVLYGLHAAHEARDERGEPLNLVHRDISPPNVLVGVDGLARVVDFGVAKASGRLQLTRDGQVKGKIAYMAPEQLTGAPLDRRADIYSASAVLWEMITGRRIVRGKTEADVFREAMLGRVAPPRTVKPTLPEALDEVTMRGLARAPLERYATAWEMALALEAAVPPAAARHVGEWVTDLVKDALAERSRAILAFESVPQGAVAETAGSTEPEPAEDELPTRVAALRHTEVSDKLPWGWDPKAPPESGDSQRGLEAELLRLAEPGIPSPTTEKKPDDSARVVAGSLAEKATRAPSHAPPGDARRTAGWQAWLAHRRGWWAPERWLARLASMWESWTGGSLVLPPAIFDGKRLRVLLGAAAVLVLVAGGGPIVWMVASRSGEPSPGGGAARGVTAEPLEPLPEVGSEVPSASGSGDTEIAEAPAPSASVPEVLTAAVAPSAASAVPPVRSSARDGGRVAPPAGRSRSRCEPPWTLDSEGIRHPKLECL